MEGVRGSSPLSSTTGRGRGAALGPRVGGVDEGFAVVLAVGGRSNSLGRVDEVVDLVLGDQRRLDELYGCFSADDAWLRMRAADALEKVCRRRPGWLSPYVDRSLEELAPSGQPSVQWHLAQIYRAVELTSEQQRRVTDWLRELLSTTDVDWIVAANAMATLARFTEDGSFPAGDLVALLEVQQTHGSKSVRRRAEGLRASLLAARDGRPAPARGPGGRVS